MKDGGSMCEFRNKINAQSAFRNLQVNPVFHNTMRDKQVKFKYNIYTLSTLSRFGDEISVLIQYRITDISVIRGYRRRTLL